MADLSKYSLNLYNLLKMGLTNSLVFNRRGNPAPVLNKNYALKTLTSPS